MTNTRKPLGASPAPDCCEGRKPTEIEKGPDGLLDVTLAYRRWLAARVKYFEDFENYEEGRARAEEEYRAVLALAAAPSELAEDVHRKLEVLLVYIAQARHTGLELACPIEAYLASGVQNDLLRLGVGRGVER